MKRLLALLAILAFLPAYAALKIGDKAPDFSTQASLGGKVFRYTLSRALKEGPAVLYFYPAAFTKGCTIEAHDFAEAVDQYKALGATVIGVSHDSIETLNRFSVSECRSKFPVAADVDQSIMRSYDAILAAKPDYASRTSYVIAPDGRIIYTYTDMNPDKHVANTLAALRQWAAEKKQP
ncbi:putative peroxiredoxin bcp [mine drainage metagenome]|uniref:thioredoxin-dependent peroxiredoxin n=1 Tax=mine drainage metagenome TaxID=410659 RepID=A0A1J5SS49_9ZZZZ